MSKYSLVLLLASATMIFPACNGGDKNEDATEMADTTKMEEQPKASNETFFQVPSPGEMLTFIKMVGGKDNKNVSFLNPPSNQKKYNDSKSKALNFGIYSCDLSYCSIFDIGSESVKYYKIVKDLGDQIGLSTTIRPEVLKRVESNIGKADSLAVIADDIYFNSFEALDGSQQGGTLAMMVSGGWIESIYIASNLAKYKEGSPIIERLADQKYTLENLIEFLKKHEADAGVAAVKADLEGVLVEFNKIQETDVKDKGKAEPGVMTLQGGKQLTMSEEIYKSIISKVSELRNKYTQNS